MGSYKQYSDTDREEALIAVEATDTIAEAARLLGMPYNTLHGWVKEYRSEGRITQIRKGKNDLAERLDTLASRLTDVQADLLERIAGQLESEEISVKDAAATLRSLATSGGIAIDKAALLRGEVPDTDSESRTLLKSLNLQVNIINGED